MPVDMQKLAQNKETIVNSIKTRGPSLPVQVAREANLSVLFASAYLSELYNERKVKMSHMKVGSSSLYYVQGQEAQLENFIQYLNSREKEALFLLKSKKMLEDEKIEPASRVALRSLRDFAIPIRIKTEDSSKLFWKHFLVSDEEIEKLANEFIQPKIEKEPEKVVKAIKERKQEPEKVIEKTKKERKKPGEESLFSKKVKEYLTKRNIDLLEIKEEKKKELLAKVALNSMFGKQEYLLIAKEKKKITEEDITIALHKAQLEKMPALFIAPGNIDKKAEEHAKTWRNLIVFEKIPSYS